jgi:hypothetical protein
MKGHHLNSSNESITFFNETVHFSNYLNTSHRENRLILQKDQLLSPVHLPSLYFIIPVAAGAQPGGNGC